ncbi:beta-propeller domain-containing protein [Candidatus Gracilibacteria bacterium]|nr:beta-propeller domain-containing protein [Candidatus Gracilibacteria bacterium]
MKKLLIAVLASAFFAAPVYAASPFNDVTDIHANVQAVDYLKTEGTVVGYGDGIFLPEQNINRAEFLKILMEVADIKVTGSECFPDVQDQWFAPYICTAKDMGIVVGDPDGYFSPARNINFAEASKIVTSTLNLDQVSLATTNWFEEFVLILESRDAIPAAIDAFDGPISRADMSEMVWRIETDTTYKVSNTFEAIERREQAVELGGELRKFDGCSELKSYLKNNVEEPFYYILESVEFEDSSPDASVKSAPVPESAAPGGAGADEFSETNVQVEGVDEADIVKNDGKYVYFLRKTLPNSVKIVEAYPTTVMSEVGEIFFDDKNFDAEEMYVDGDRLIVVGNVWSDVWRGDMRKIAFFPVSSSTKVYIFDISDKANPKSIREVTYAGAYTSSRKINDTVYVVSSQKNYFYPSLLDGIDDLRDSDLSLNYSDSNSPDLEKMAACSDISFIPGVISSTDFMTITAIPTDDVSGEIAKEVIMGSAGNIYASKDNLYIAEPKYSWSEWSEGEETFVHKFALDAENFEYKGVGSVPGTVLNQYSMDEKGEYFRIATTVGNNWWSGSGSYNNVYVMDGNMEVVGSVENLAEGERIFSTRFVGDRLYMVTFEQVDPLFVIDLASPTNPTVLGELKIPGVSEYLHPFGDHHLIGIGRDADPEGFFKGMKISMFDVSDVTAPSELHTEYIGDRGTWSPVFNDPKAFLFDLKKGLMAFPLKVAQLSDVEKNDPDLSLWKEGDFVFQGAYVYDVSVSDGFELQGAVSHYEPGEVKEMEYYWSGDSDILRALWIGDYLYTISNDFVKANELDGLEEAGSVALPMG